MPWTDTDVLALWDDATWNFDRDLPSFLKSYAAGFADVANLFEEALGRPLGEYDLPLALVNMDRVQDAPGVVRDAFARALTDECGQAVPEGVAALVFRPVVVPPRPPPLSRLVTPELTAAILRIRRLRTPDRHARGARLAATARRCLGQWRWLPRAPESVVPYRHDRGRAPGAPRLPGDTGWTDLHGFDRWVRGGGPPPLGTVALNCWESVLVTAFDAGLLSLGRIRAAYDAARMDVERILLGTTAFHRTPNEQWTPSMSEMANRAYDAYIGRLERQILDRPNAVPVSLQRGLVPKPGDLVMVNGHPIAHVCISLGRTWNGPVAKDQVASLWTQDSGRFTTLDIQELAPSESELSFVPCPF